MQLMVPLIQPIRTEVDYRAALQMVAPYFENEPEVGSDAGAHFEAMISLIEAYEIKCYPIARPDRVDNGPTGKLSAGF